MPRWFKFKSMVEALSEQSEREGGASFKAESVAWTTIDADQKKLDDFQAGCGIQLVLGFELN